MPTATITSKGQITLPKAVREQLHVDQGDRVEFVIDGRGAVWLRPMRGSARRLTEIIARVADAKSLEQLDVDLADALAEDDRRIAGGSVEGRGQWKPRREDVFDLAILLALPLEHSRDVETVVGSRGDVFELHPLPWTESWNSDASIDLGAGPLAAAATLRRLMAVRKDFSLLRIILKRLKRGAPEILRRVSRLPFAWYSTSSEMRGLASIRAQPGHLAPPEDWDLASSLLAQTLIAHSDELRGAPTPEDSTRTRAIHQSIEILTTFAEVWRLCRQSSGEDSVSPSSMVHQELADSFTLEPRLERHTRVDLQDAFREVGAEVPARLEQFFLPLGEDLLQEALRELGAEVASHP